MSKKMEAQETRPDLAKPLKAWAQPISTGAISQPSGQSEGWEFASPNGLRLKTHDKSFYEARRRAAVELQCEVGQLTLCHVDSGCFG